MRDPKLFFNDMLRKRSVKLRQGTSVENIKKDYQGKHHFTVVTACYNVEKYLDEFFDSIVKQTLNFEKHIQVICVDDGSLDNTAQIINAWVKKYPQNIHYFYKENGGQASARNMGIKHVQTEYVSFIDSDDFISTDYFQRIDEFLKKQTDVALVSCPYIFYFEDKDMLQDSHPLKYRFAKGDQIFPVSNLQNHMQLSVNSAIFRIDIIRKNDVQFLDIKPSFEDARFVADYLIASKDNQKVGFISKGGYYYRKRSDGTSTLDTAWLNVGLFSTVLEKGCLSVLRDAKERYGYVPVHSQRTVLYHLAWYFRRIVNKANSISHLTNEQKSNFRRLVNEIFSYIDEKTIWDFNLAGTWFLQRVAWLGLFKKTVPQQYFAYVDKYDVRKDQVLIRYYSNFDFEEKWFADKKEVLPVYRKLVKHDFMGEVYTREYRVWLPVGNVKKLELYLDNIHLELTLNGKRYKELSLDGVKEYFMNKSSVKTDAWIIMDRDIQADDNAEHLYRYIQQNHLKQNVYFALNKDSHDWERLEQEGFNLLAFGSAKFERVLRGCHKIISSHIDRYITHYFDDDSLVDKDYVFLQHGITKDNISTWLNTKQIACFITATNDEFHSIADDDSPYNFGKKETKLTGFPRHDKLLAGNQEDTKTILIMPTWRNSIVGKNTGNGNEREINTEFMQTEYAQHWQGVLASKKLNALVEQFGYKVIFAPHANIEPYLSQFEIPSYIEIWNAEEGNIQKLFQTSTLMITDYSSVAFEMGYLNKLVLYYQFDKDDVFSGNGHFYQEGYFKYEQHGFGPVSYDEDALLRDLETILKSGGKVIEPYITRIQNTFPLRDGKNCERVYQAIKALDEKEPYVSKEIAISSLNKAIQKKQHDLIISRYEYIMNNGLNDSIIEFNAEYKKAKEKNLEKRIESAWDKQMYTQLIDLIPYNYLTEHKDKDKYIRYLIISYRKNYRWKDIISLLPILSAELKKKFVYQIVLAHYRLGLINDAYALHIKPENSDFYDYWALIAELAFLKEDYDLAKYCYKGMISIFPDKDYKDNLIKLYNLYNLK